MVDRRVLELLDGRQLVAYDSGTRGGTDALSLIWHHGTPQTGALLEPLVAATAARNIRLISYARPSYGGSSPKRGRDIAAAADDVRQVADALAIERFATMGASSGGAHALACAALLPDRVIGTVSLASPAPYTESFDWYAGMAAPQALRAAAAGRATREQFAESAEFDPNIFTAADWAALDGPWASLGQDAQRAGADGPEGEVDDDLALAAAWGVDLSAIRVPVLLVQGGEDRVIPPSHGYALLQAVPTAQFWLRPPDGHVSVMHACPVALDWLLDLRTA